MAPAHVYLTVREAADRARVSVWTIRRALREGKIEGGVAGRRWRIRPEAIDRWLHGGQDGDA